MKGKLPLKGLLILMLGIIPVFLFVSPGSALKYTLANKANQPMLPLNKNLYELLTMTNAERKQAKLTPLKLNSKLIRSAQVKCDDMVARNYWGHITPEGRGMDVFLAKAGINNYTKAAENLAIGQISLDEVNSDWMNSPAHREAILGREYTDVGFSSCTYDNKQPGLEPLTIYVEHFLAKR